MDYLLKGVRAIDPAIGLDAKRDILIEDGVIARVEEAIEPTEGVKGVSYTHLDVYKRQCRKRGTWGLRREGGGW